MAEKETKAKVFYDEVMEDQPLQEPLNYKYILQTPTSLSDINRGEGSKLDSAVQADDLGDLAWLDAINDVINSRINTQTAEILSDWTFGSSGSIKIATSSSSGIWISPTGILTKKNGDTTFALTLDGSATYKGEIAASQITAGTLTGFTIQTASSGKRIRLHHDTYQGYGVIDFYDSSGLVGRITPAPSAKGTGMQFRAEAYGWYPTLTLADGSSSAEASITISGYGLGAAPSYNWSNQDFYLLDNSSIYFGGSGRIYKDAYGSVGIQGSGDIIPIENSYFDLGGPSDRYYGIYLATNPSVSSSRKIKKDITNCQYGLKDIIRLQPRRYKLKKNNKETIGLVTEEIKEVIPEVLDGDEAYRPADLIPVLVNAIKELNSKVDNLAKQVKVR